MKELKIGIIGGAGYTGGELLRLLLQHEKVKILFVTSRKLVGKSVFKKHPNLRGFTDLKFISPNDITAVDVLYLCLPHGATASGIESYLSISNYVIDLSADFRLKSLDDYKTFYNYDHPNPKLMQEFVYGMPELYREQIKKSNKIAVPGCTATGAILPLLPIAENFNIKTVVIDAKVGSSASGASPSEGSHHPERHGVVRSFKPAKHRHIAEMNQELNFSKDGVINFSPHAIEMVRGIQSTIHVFFEEDYEEKDIWRSMIERYKDEPFIRFVREKSGGYRFPEPKIVMGTNLCDIGFEKDTITGRLILISAIDNLIKGASGQAIQCMNIALGFDETTGLKQLGFHP
ncbi:MAG: N-acetyl-gamma-glutamyl-phosphate reductase [Candidatus Marinimicrobia bacterium]|nr:N-acetyl-gamma-glutamyl-phosphate reductase [Candidatus Neomarinimicrobiota bacterium]|tara:strand:- start:613 stop:1650 length:1038 start_codon:yes stop_codon:yes gene_type:complete